MNSRHILAADFGAALFLVSAARDGDHNIASKLWRSRKDRPMAGAITPTFSKISRSGPQPAGSNNTRSPDVE